MNGQETQQGKELFNAENNENIYPQFSVQFVVPRQYSSRVIKNDQNDRKPLQFIDDLDSSLGDRRQRKF